LCIRSDWSRSSFPKISQMDMDDFAGTTDHVTDDKPSVPKAGGTCSPRNLEHYRKGLGQDKKLEGYQKRLARVIKAVEEAKEDPDGMEEYSVDDIGRDKVVETSINWGDYKWIANQKLSVAAIKEVFRDDRDVQERFKTKKLSSKSSQRDFDAAFTKFEAFIKKKVCLELAGAATDQTNLKTGAIAEDLNMSLASIQRYLNMFKKSFGNEDNGDSDSESEFL
ncbi:unnamed protein product, partial [Allacma fusca]